jgi:hypothetical protein
MRIIDHEQRSPEWHQARLGCPTASNFGKLINPTGAKSTQAKSYINELIAQKLTGESPEITVTEWMERGTELEAKARSLYQLMTDSIVVEAGLCKHDTLEAGASPDGLISNDGGLEIKVFKPANHVAVLRSQEMPTLHIPQVQGCMWITDREWWDFVSYHETMPIFVTRIRRDDEYIEKLAAEVEKACEEITKETQRLELIR